MAVHARCTTWPWLVGRSLAQGLTIMTAALRALQPLQGLPLLNEGATGAAHAHVPGKRQAAASSAGSLQLQCSAAWWSNSGPSLRRHANPPNHPAPPPNRRCCVPVTAPLCTGASSCRWGLVQSLGRAGGWRWDVAQKLQLLVHCFRVHAAATAMLPEPLHTGCLRHCWLCTLLKERGSCCNARPSSLPAHEPKSLLLPHPAHRC